MNFTPLGIYPSSKWFIHAGNGTLRHTTVTSYHVHSIGETISMVVSFGRHLWFAYYFMSIPKYWQNYGKNIYLINFIFYFDLSRIGFGINVLLPIKILQKVKLLNLLVESQFKYYGNYKTVSISRKCPLHTSYIPYSITISH